MTRASDLADIADIATETLVNAKITTAQREAARLDTTNPSGVCWTDDCETETGHEKRFCCVECRDIWQRDNEPRRR